MFFDYQMPTLAGGIIVYPDAVFTPIPLQPGQIIETVTIGASSSTTIGLTGTVDD